VLEPRRRARQHLDRLLQMRDRLGHGAGEDPQRRTVGAWRAEPLAELELLAREPLSLCGLAQYDERLDRLGAPAREHRVGHAEFVSTGGGPPGIGQRVLGPVLREAQPGATLQQQRRCECADRRGLWDAVAPGGHLAVQDYDLRSVSVLPALNSVNELLRVVIGAFTAVGCDVHAGARLPQLFAQAGIGSPDGTDVAGRIEPLGLGRALFERSFRSVLPTALAHGITTETGAAAALAAIDRDATEFTDRPVLWPLLIGAWKRKEQA
jgi:hypothetical protein